MNKIALLVVAFILVVGMSRIAIAQELEDDLTNHPDPAWAEYYRQHATDIESLRRQIIQGETAQRLNALEQLARLYPDAVLSTSIELLDDRSLEIAQKAAELLASSIVMSDHQTAHQEHAKLNSYQKYTIEQHTTARVALLKVLEDPRAELREVAAKILASLSDEEALSKINAGIQTGLYSETEAVNYFGLARPDVGNQYLEPYLVGGSNEARAGAALYLGGNPQYQAQIRDSILFDPSLDASIRSAAAEILSRYDPNYQNYALILTLDPSIPPPLYTTVVESYVDSLQADNSLNSANARVLRTAIENYQIQNPEADVEQIEKSLEQYGE